MSSERPEYWDKYCRFAMKDMEEDEAEKILKKADEAAEIYREKGYLHRTPRDASKDDNLFYYYLYQNLGQGKITEKGVISPVAAHKDSSWMISSDFCFLNIRACCPNHNKTGTIADALRILPVIRADSFHLAPFFDCTMDNLYAVDSLRIITQDVVDRGMLEAGMAPHEQLLLLLDAIHLLGKTAGFDLEPHTSQFSRVVLENPQHFRWLHLDEKKTGLAGGLSHEEMFSPAQQKKIVQEVRDIVNNQLAGHSLSSVEDLTHGVETVRKAHGDILNRLIEMGYWTLPSHTWNGVGLPQFDRYNEEGKYPDFTYLDEEGEDQHAQSFGMLTPFSIYTNLPFNRVPSLDDPPLYKEDTMDFLTGIFPGILKKYPFDYVRIDYIDHVFDSTVEESWDVPSSDRMAPKVLQAIIDRAREGRPYLGAMAERMGQDIWDYRKVGIDLVLGQDVLTTMHPGYLSFCFDIQQKIEQQAQEWETPASVLFAVDTHDSGHPLFWTMPLSQVTGPSGLSLRHFLARFFYGGKLRRPKYEVMGNQDLSYGLYEANNKTLSLNWKGDKDYNRRYHAIEDIYEELKDMLKYSDSGPRHYHGTYAYWFHNFKRGRNARILCFAMMEKEVKKLKMLLENKPVYEPLDYIQININEHYDIRNPEVFEYDLSTGKKSRYNQEFPGVIALKNIEPLGTRLFIIEEKD